MEKLYQIIWDFEQKEILSSHHQEICIAASKLLGKLGHIPRTIKNKLRLKYKKKRVDFEFIVNLSNPKKMLNLDIDITDAINLTVDMINLFVNKKGSGVGIRVKHMKTCSDFLKFCLLRILKKITPELFKKVEGLLLHEQKS